MNIPNSSEHANAIYDAACNDVVWLVFWSSNISSNFRQSGKLTVAQIAFVCMFIVFMCEFFAISK